MVDAETLLGSGLAHVVTIVLGLVGIAALVTTTVAGASWFWLFYLVICASFLDLFDDDPSWWQRFGGDSESVEAEEETTDEDAMEVLKRRYAAGEIDDGEFEARLDALLETPDSRAELETERN